jgi:hypothetical protein
MSAREIMAIRKLYGTATLGGVFFWSDVAAHDGWRVQYNRTLDKASPLNAYRLIDAENQLWASADSASELSEALPALVEEFSTKTPLLGNEQAKQLLIAALSAGLKMAIARLDKTTK